MMKGGTSQNLSSSYFHNSCIYVEIMGKLTFCVIIMTQNVNFPIGPACQNTQRMHKATLIVSKVHMVYCIQKQHKLFTRMLHGDGRKCKLKLHQLRPIITLVWKAYVTARLSNEIIVSNETIFCHKLCQSAFESSVKDVGPI